MTSSQLSSASPIERHAFASTRWSMVLAAGGAAPSTARAALADLCETYWYPLYAYVRRQGYTASDAEDLTQGFFARLLDKEDLRRAQPQRGKFRSFLLTCLKHFLANERDRAAALKRGGGRVIQSLDAEAAEKRYHLEPAHEETPERIFDRGWAVTLLDRTLERLREEFATTGKERLFDQLKTFLTGQRGHLSQQEIAAQWNMTEQAVKAAVYRLRRRFRRKLEEEIAHTVADEHAVEEELQNLFTVLSS